MEHTHVLSFKNPSDLPFEAQSWIRVAQRGDLEVGSQKTEERIGEGENPERVNTAKGQVVEVSLSSASFLPQTKSYLHFPVPFPQARHLKPVTRYYLTL